ncbi:MAG: argS [Bacteroidetes bacterium]|nr:argS [Bacteroidota bacterium]
MKAYLRATIAEALQKAGFPAPPGLTVERPRQEGHGDLTTNVAMVLAKSLGKKPRALAEEIVAHMPKDPALIAQIEVAGPGFINVTFTDTFFRRQLADLLHAESAFGRSTLGNGRRVQVEFVSANPTGPLTVGHGRGAVFGDTVSRLLEWTGHQVEREYYFNNAGRQMRILGDSVRLRYLEQLGDPVEFPQDYYQGEYIKDIARRILEQHGESKRQEPAEGLFKSVAEEVIFADIRATLNSLGITFASYFNEHSLYTDGRITEVVEALKQRGLTYEQDGALWFKASALGNEKDKVIIKSTGEPTYRLPDIAYHCDKFRRQYDLMIDIFGADHVATYPDVLVALKALGYDTNKVKVLIHQFVTIMQGNEVVKMSTRKANFITLDELVEDVGTDAVRYFFIMRTISSHLNFDLALARQQSDENPVYYVQYAHARISSILRFAAREGRNIEQGALESDLLTAPEEMTLIKRLLQFPEVVESCALTHEPHRLADYLHDLAGTFHLFYHHHRVVTQDERLTTARLALVRCVQIVLRNGFTILGINAPEQM